MTDRDALLASVLAAPDDDAPRVIYADWLDEHGQPERAEFIRHSIQFRFNGRRVGHAADVLKEAERGPLPPLPLGGLTFRRGFVHSVACPAADWLAFGDAILAGHPVREVRLTRRPPTTAIFGQMAARDHPDRLGAGWLARVERHSANPTGLFAEWWPSIKTWEMRVEEVLNPMEPGERP